MSAVPAVAAGFHSLRTRNYRLFFFGQLVSLAGTWMQEVAQAWLVLRLTESPLALGIAMAIRFAPSLMLSLFGGVLADRFPKRRLLMATQSVMLVQALLLGVLAALGTVRLEHLYILAAVRGLADAVDVPVRQSMVVEMVGPADVGNAVALNSTLFNLARIAGPALGGAVIVTLGVAACFFLNSLSFLAVLLALLLMRPQEFHAVPRPKQGRVLGQLGDGFRYVRHTPDVLLILVLVAVVGTFGYNFQVVLPLLAKYVLGVGAAGLGALTAALGVGSVLAALVAAYRARPRKRVFLGAAGSFSLLLLLVGLSGSPTVTLLLLVGVGFTGILFHTAANTRLQLTVPNELRGRVMSMYSLLFVGTTPLGSLLVGVLAERQGVRLMLVESALLTGLGVGFALLFALRVRRRQAAAPPGTPALPAVAA